MRTKISAIYVGQCLINSKIYVGSSKDTWKRVDKEHIKGLRKNQHCNKFLQEDWNFYGEENFFWYIVELIDIKDRKVKEQYWMDYFQSGRRKYGYNIWRTVRELVPFERASEIQKELWAQKDHYEKMCQARKDYYKDNLERKLQDSLRSLEFWKNEDYRRNQEEIRSNPEFRKNISDKITDLWSQENYRNNQTLAITEAVRKPESRENAAMKMEKLWATEEYSNNMKKIRKEKIWDNPVKRAIILAAMAKGRKERQERLKQIRNDIV